MIRISLIAGRTGPAFHRKSPVLEPNLNSDRLRIGSALELMPKDVSQPYDRNYDEEVRPT